MDGKRKAMTWGAFCADALALGAHWVYNTRVIDKKFGRLEHYQAPLTSYHKGKEAGDFTHYGDQMMVLMESIAATERFDGEQFAGQWKNFFGDYEGYFDKATKTTLEQMEANGDLLNSGSPSDDLAGAARIAPVVYVHHSSPEKLEKAVRMQTAITHNNAVVIETAVFFAQAAVGVLEGESPVASIEKLLAAGNQTDLLTDLIQDGMESQNQDTRETIHTFGQMCSVEAALPGTIHLICTYENDLKQALVENVMAGGDSSARGILVGMILGAHKGMGSIPKQWIDDLNQGRRIHHLLDILEGA
jgi:ADP-ribosylglycohydrolase